VLDGTVLEQLRYVTAFTALEIGYLVHADLARYLRRYMGLTQAELSELTGRERSVIARWEQGAVSPSIDNLIQIVQACGFDLPLVLFPKDTTQDEQLRKNTLLSPERRARQMIARDEKGERGVGG